MVHVRCLGSKLDVISDGVITKQPQKTSCICLKKRESGIKKRLSKQLLLFDPIHHKRTTLCFGKVSKLRNYSQSSSQCETTQLSEYGMSDRCLFSYSSDVWQLLSDDEAFLRPQHLRRQYTLCFTALGIREPATGKKRKEKHNQTKPATCKDKCQQQ